MTTESKSDQQAISETYQMMSDKQHVLERPSTYLGSVKRTENVRWILDGDKFTRQSIGYIQGLYKLMDEAIVNCRDHVERMVASTDPNKQLVTRIDVSIDPITGTFSFQNDGTGLDVVMHPQHNILIPELVFGNLRTSTNYSEAESLVGGQNGFGSKLINIWSTEFTVDIIDTKRGLRYTQVFRDNLSVTTAPSIVKTTVKRGYTRITFKADYKRFGVTLPLSVDMMNLFHRRVYDVAAVTARGIKVYMDGVLVPIRDFKQYATMAFGGATLDVKMAYERDETPAALGRWEYAVALVGDVPGMSHEFTQISFVNGIHTHQGGTHVDHVMNQISRKMVCRQQ